MQTSSVEDTSMETLSSHPPPPPSTHDHTQPETQLPSSSSSSSYSSPPPEGKITCFTLILAFLSAIGGFLFGYDTGVVSGVLIMIKPSFQLSSFMQEVFVSLTMGAAMLFSLIGGVTNDLIGRKPNIYIASLVFVVGSVVLAAAHDLATLLVGRFIIGIGIGLTSMSSPMYVAECSSKLLRGRLVTMFNLFVTLGQFVSVMICAFFSDNKMDGWRYVLGLAGVPAFIQFIFFIFMPESPRWLVSKNRLEEARKVLMKINGIKSNHTGLEGLGGDEEKQKEVENELKLILQDIHENEKKKNPGFFKTLERVLRTGHARRALVVGVSLQLIQQLVGINTVMYYSASIIQMSGVHNIHNILWLAALVAGIYLISAVGGLFLVDRVGRRPLTLLSLLGTMIGLLVLGSGFLLADINSPPISLNASSSSTCSPYEACNTCVHNPSCAFCFQDNSPNSFCLPINTTLKQEGGEICSNAYNHTHFHPITTPPAEVVGGRDDDVTVGGETWKMVSDYCMTSFSWIATFGMIIYLVSFSPGMGPMPWTINSEIYPSWARSTCVSIATSVNWSSNLLVSLTFLTLVEAITAYGTFFLYASISVISFILLFLILPETKNKRLEEIEELFKGDLTVLWKRGKDGPVYRTVES